jgi:hypothetical protein
LGGQLDLPRALDYRTLLKRSSDNKYIEIDSIAANDPAWASLLKTPDGRKVLRLHRIQDCDDGKTCFRRIIQSGFPTPASITNNKKLTYYPKGGPQSSISPHDLDDLILLFE